MTPEQINQLVQLHDRRHLRKSVRDCPLCFFRTAGLLGLFILNAGSFADFLGPITSDLAEKINKVSEEGT